MAEKTFLAVDADGTEYIFSEEPTRNHVKEVWMPYYACGYCWLPSGTIRKLIGRDLTWSDDPVNLD